MSQKQAPKDDDNDDTKPREKLRSARDVMDRLKWDTSSGYTLNTTLLGYDDRILGPMEKPVADFKDMDHGGDIPEHRIQWFRVATTEASNNTPRAQDFLWDRRSRTDRLFGSGNGSHASISPTTLQDAQRAHATALRLQEEREQTRGVERGNEQAREIRRQLAATRAANPQPPSQTPVELQRRTSDVRQQLELQSIGENENGAMQVEPETCASENSRKRPLEEILQAKNTKKTSTSPLPPSLDQVNRIRLEAIFHPKFENENERDQQIRAIMKERVTKGEGYLEVSLKHSGSLILWSGGQRYYSKNSTDNRFTHVGEILLRQHFVRAYWKDDQETHQEAGDSVVGLSESRYQECSNHVEAQRLTLAFEVVTAVLGDHGDRPKRDFLILTAVADRSEERFFSTVEVVDLAQRFRLPHNDIWAFSSANSTDKLFDFYDNCRETSLATFVEQALDQAAETRVRSLYPHTVFQGDILEGIVIRYVANKQQQSEKGDGTLIERVNRLAETAETVLSEKVPSGLPDCFVLIADLPDCPRWLSCDLRTIFYKTRCKLEGPDSFAASVENLLGNQDRRKGKRLPKLEVAHVPALLRKLKDSPDVETQRIAHVVQSLDKLNIRVDYSVVQEEICDFGFARWLCIIHVILDHSHQKFRKNMSAGDMALYRGFALELTTETGFSANRRVHTMTSCDDTGSDSETSLMLKMKFLPYMVRTFGCRNGLRSLSQGGPEGFIRYTSNLLSKWQISANARKVWMPFFRAWAEYAGPRLTQRMPQDGDLPLLTSNNYLEHLERFIPLYENGAFTGPGSFRGFLLVVSPDEQTAKDAADFIAQQIGSKLRYDGSESVPGGTSAEGGVCSVSVEDRPGRFRKLFENYGESASIIFFGCSDEEVKSLVGEDKSRQILGKLNGWRKLKTFFDFELPLNSIPDRRLADVEESAAASSISDEMKSAINQLLGTTKDDGVSESQPGLLVFFPQIPGCGKSSLVNESAEEEIKAFLSTRTTPKRSLTVRMGDKTKGKYWPLVKKEKKSDVSGVYIADKNVPASSWDLIANVCGETSAIGVPVIPEHAIKTTVVEGIRWPRDGQVSMNRSHTFPFSLEYLAVCMSRVLSRPANSHPGKLDSGTKRACMIVVMFFCLYQKVSADEFLASLALNFEKNSAFLSREPIEVSFFRSKEPGMPTALKDILVEAIRAQCGYNIKRTDVGKVKDDYLDSLESRLRAVLHENKKIIESLTVSVEESQESFLSNVKNAVVQADSGGGFLEENGVDEDEGLPGADKSIHYISIDVAADAVHQFILSHATDSNLKDLWDNVAGTNHPEDVFKGRNCTDKRVICDTHITLAHRQEQSQQEMRETYEAVEGQTVTVNVTAILWDDKTVALETKVPATTNEGASLRPSKNNFDHITLWVGNGTRAFRSNELPRLVAEGNAKRVDFEETKSLLGVVAL